MTHIKYQIYKQIDKLTDKKLQVGLSKLEQERLNNLWDKYDFNTLGEVKTSWVRV